MRFGPNPNSLQVPRQTLMKFGMAGAPSSEPPPPVDPVYQTLFDHTTATPTPVIEGVAYTLGILFAAKVAGQIHGITFYRIDQDATTSRTVALFDNNNGLASAALVTATSTETPSINGMVYVPFAEPFTVTPNAPYVAAVHYPTNYVVTGGYFPAGPTDTPSFVIPGSTTDLTFFGPGNGRFTDNFLFAYPTNSYQGANYWVDIKFLPD